MTKKEISQALENIHNKSKINEEVTPILLNLVETLASDNARLEEEIQTLKDENNILKGLQGKPNIKANNNKDGNISSEQERKEAESSEEEKIAREGFKIDKKSIEKLKENRIPNKVLDQLNTLQGCKYTNKAEFVNAVENAIGKELTIKYINLLVKYAQYKKRNRKAKIPEIKIDREELCPVDKTLLPEDAKLKSYEYKVVQDLIIKTDNVKFKRELYYSPSKKKTYLGDVPKGFEGEYGPTINTNILTMKYINNMSIPKIKEFYNNVNTSISSSYISNRLTKHIGHFHHEKSELYQASLETMSYQQVDDTGSRVNGENYYTQIVCNDLCTIFFTTKNKDRLTILDILQNFGPRNFMFNVETFSLLKKLKVPNKIIALLHEVEKNRVFNEQELEEILNKYYPNPPKGKQSRVRIMEASAIAYYHQQMNFPIVKVLVSDDAPQFKLLTEELLLCWVHDGRHYKRLKPVVLIHEEKVHEFLGLYWLYYRNLLEYKKSPSDKLAKSLSSEFDVLFSTKTDYDELDKRIAKSKSKKTNLLITALNHPELPLHNNRSENGARVQKRREDVSLQTKTKEGTESKDTMMSIVETCKKLGISSYKFIHDRISRKNKFPTLAEQLRAKASMQPVNCNNS